MDGEHPQAAPHSDTVKEKGRGRPKTPPAQMFLLVLIYSLRKSRVWPESTRTPGPMVEDTTTERT